MVPYTGNGVYKELNIGTGNGTKCMYKICYKGVDMIPITDFSIKYTGNEYSTKYWYWKWYKIHTG